MLPRVLAAPDAPAARSAINRWIAGLGPVPPCTPCATLDETDLHLRPPVTWLTDDLLGAELGATLRGIHRNRPTEKQQFYVSLVPNIGNPSFEHEPAYATLKLPDAGLSAARPLPLLEHHRVLVSVSRRDRRELG